MNITKKLIILLVTVSLIGVVVLGIFFNYSMKKNMMQDIDANAMNLIGRTVQMFVVSTVKFHEQFNAVTSQEEKEDVHRDWMRTSVAVDTAVVHDYGDKQTRVRLVTDSKMLDIPVLGGSATKVENSFERDSLRTFLNGGDSVKVVTEDMYRFAVPLYSDAHPGCAECHSMDTSKHILLGSLNVYIPLEEKLSNLSSVVMNNLLMMALIGFFLVVTLMLFLRNIVIKPINILEETTIDLASGEGDLTKRLPVKSTDEIGHASEGVNDFISKVQTIMTDVKDSSEQNTDLASSLADSANVIGKGIEEGAEVTVAATKEAQDIKRIIEGSLSISQSTRDNILKANDNLEEAKSFVLKLTQDVHNSAEVESELSDRLNNLSSEAAQVKDVLTVISDIADQTNLLALNAAIEAARAGEHGRGFAVVADEVRKLAERTQKSLAEINATINTIVQSIVEVSSDMNKNVEKVQELTSLSSNVEEMIGSTSSLMNDSAEIAEESFQNSLSVSNNTEHLISKIEMVNESTKTYVHEVDGIVNTSNMLNEFSVQLKAKLNQYKTS